jgi:hypothetical protein
VRNQVAVMVEAGMTHAAVADELGFCRSYAYAYYLHDESVDWKRVNEAIIERWSPERLRRIKGLAWAQAVPGSSS